MQGTPERRAATGLMLPESSIERRWSWQWRPLGRQVIGTVRESGDDVDHTVLSQKAAVPQSMSAKHACVGHSARQANGVLERNLRVAGVVHEQRRNADATKVLDSIDFLEAHAIALLDARAHRVT